MKDVHDVVINVSASVLFVALGFVLQFLLQRVRQRGTRRFWRGRGREAQVSLVLGTFPQFRGFEPSGLLGVGDMRAVYELTRALTLAGISVEAAYGSGLEDQQLAKDLVIIGGTDVNEIARSLVDSGKLGFRFSYEPTLRLYDSHEKRVYQPVFLELELSEIRDQTLDGLNIMERNGKRVAGQVIKDYGVLVRTLNPFNPDRYVIAVAGLYGFGTWGGARLLADPRFLAACLKMGSSDFECVYSVDVYQGKHVVPRLLSLRPLARRG